MTKIVLINGLARGGTNLAANLFAAQDRWHVSDAGIAEFACIDQLLPKDFANHYPIRLEHAKVKALIDGKLERFKDLCLARMVSTVFPSYASIRTNYHTKAESYYGVPVLVWGQYLREIAAIKSFAELDKIYLNFAAAAGCEILGHRTTALTSYAAAFLSRSDAHYWVEITRDPFDRAVSSRTGHAQCLTQSFLQSKWQLEHIDALEHERFIQINYEDLCREPVKCVRKVGASLGVTLDEIRVAPVTPDMSWFYGNSSFNPNIFDQVERAKPIYVDSIGGGNQLSAGERRLGESIVLRNRIPVLYFTVLLVTDALYRLGELLKRASAGFLMFFHLSMVKQAGLRKVYARCLSRFT